MKCFSENPKSFVATICFLAVAAMAPAVLATEAEVIRLSEPVAVTDSYEFFGATLPEDGNAISLGELIVSSDDYLDKQVIVETRIAKVCQKKGCFFVAQAGEHTVRITFKDYGFFIPSDSGGKNVTLAGTFSRKPVSKEQAEHYAADLGESAVPSPAQFEYSIVASAVRLPRG